MSHIIALWSKILSTDIPSSVTLGKKLQWPAVVRKSLFFFF